MQLSNKLIVSIRIIRPVNFIITFFTIIVSAIICSGENPRIAIILLAAFSGAITAASGNVINDYYDIEVDRINKPSRPLPSGIILPREAFALYTVLVSLSILLSSIININAFLIVLCTNIILFIYSFKLKRILLAGNITIAALTGLAFIYGGAAVNNISSSIIPAVFAFLINFMREIVKDLEDIEGDVKKNVFTFPYIFGSKTAVNLITVSAGLLLIATFYPFIFEKYKIEYFIIVMALVNPLTIYIIKQLNKNYSRPNLSKISSLLKVNMILGLIAIYLGV